MHIFAAKCAANMSSNHRRRADGDGGYRTLGTGDVDDDGEDAARTAVKKI